MLSSKAWHALLRSYMVLAGAGALTATAAALLLIVSWDPAADEDAVSVIGGCALVGATVATSLFVLVATVLTVRCLTRITNRSYRLANVEARWRLHLRATGPARFRLPSFGPRWYLLES